MKTIYTLSDKGARERAAASPTLPAELAGLLRLVDGQRTGAQVLAVAGKNALTAGGLRWLTAAGYIQPTQQAALDAGPDSVTATAHDASGAVPAPTPPRRPRSDEEVCHALSGFMVQAIRRHLGEGGYTYRRHIERARTVADLLPHLNPLIEAIVRRSGRDAAAEFADTAAFILSPRERDSLFN